MKNLKHFVVDDDLDNYTLTLDLDEDDDPRPIRRNRDTRKERKDTYKPARTKAHMTRDK